MGQKYTQIWVLYSGVGFVTLRVTGGCKGV